jgi:predicted AAA+ superfamily ATPase
MMTNNIIATLLEEFQAKLAKYESIVPREIIFPKSVDKIFVAIGMRRTGKTYFLLQTVKELLAKGIPMSRILYINFEDDRLYPLSQEKLRNLLESFYALYPENHEQKCYIFLDEIQNVEQWSIVIRRYYDTKQAQLFLTGSSAKLLSSEIASSLRGRSLAIEVWPFNFSEYLTAKHVATKKEPHGKKYLDTMYSCLRSYLEQGGFPEVVNATVGDRMRILQDYVNVVIFRDIVERYKITNTTLVKYLIKTLLKNAGSYLSTNKLFNDLKSQGFVVGKNTIHEYLGHIEDAYLAFRVSLYSESIRKMQTNPKKIYAIDSGLINAYTIGISENKGHFLENLVYLDLRRRKQEIFYYLTKNRNEVDFLTKSLKGKWQLYQVVWDIEDRDTFEREKRALHEAEKELGIKGQIITPEVYLSEWI